MIKRIEVRFCGHCGNETPHTVQSEFEDRASPDSKCVSWTLLQCGTCSRPTLVESILAPATDYDEDGPIRSVQSKSVIYPSGTRLQNLPKKVEGAYQKALKHRRRDPEAFAIFAGRTLEAICRNENVPHFPLAKGLSMLTKTGRLPETFTKMAGQIRELRNLGAHDTGASEMSLDEAETIFSFLEALMEYLYVANIKISTLEKKLKKRKKPK